MSIVYRPDAWFIYLIIAWQQVASTQCSGMADILDLAMPLMNGYLYSQFGGLNQAKDQRWQYINGPKSFVHTM